jgi:hypothetical protein
VVLVCGLGSPACQRPSASISNTSGITGVVQAGPTCPVEKPGSPCPDSPLTSTVKATRTDGWTAQIKTDDRGRFRLPLPPGRYLVTAIAETVPPTVQPLTVEVNANVFARVTIEADTGIR